MNKPRPLAERLGLLTPRHVAASATAGTLAVVRSSSSSGYSRAAYTVTADGAELVGRWSPGRPVPKRGEAEPNTLGALARHALAHASAVIAGLPTADNPRPARRDWRDRRAA